MSNIRFMANNFLDADAVYSNPSEHSSDFVAENVFDDRRTLQWVASSDGNYRITSSNCKVYLTKSAVDYTATIPNGTYTAATFVTAVNAAIAATGISGVTIASYATAPQQFEFNSTTSAVTLKLATTTDAAWDALGYTTASDISGLVVVADSARQHTEERFIWDLGVNMTPTFFGAIGKKDEVFPLSPSGVYKIMGSNSANFDSPDLSETITYNEAGLMHFLAAADTSYRFWCFEIVDPENAAFANSLAPHRLGYIYLGDYDTFTTTNLATGFSKSYVDETTEVRSLGGVSFYGTRQKYRQFSSCQIQYPTAAERLALEQIAFDTAQAGRFFVSFDPSLAVSTTIDEYTFFAKWNQIPSFNHIIRDLYICQFGIDEAI